MRKYKISFLLLVTIFTFSFAQTQQDVSQTNAALEAVGAVPESLDANVDSLLASWHVQYFNKRNEYCHDDEANVIFPDSVYIQRLASLPRIIPLPYNPVVRDCIDLYADRKRGLVKYMLGMADFYFPIIEQVLDKNGLPIELKYLAVVESALNPVALSRVGACGLWQFMLPTGKSYGLEINSLVDERRDPLKATEAACRYFKDMYAVYGDWNLVMAAYNCGPGNVNKAIRRSGGKTDFWDIFPFLPKETRSYVPLFIAANYIMNYSCEHNLCPVETDLPMATDTVMINNALHFEQVAEVLNLDIASLRALNPQYKRDIIPGNAGPCVLKLPAAQTYAFIDKEDTIYTHRAEELLANCIDMSALTKEDGRKATKEKITHKVAAGENVYTIANRYGVNAKDIRKWNRLGSNKVARGKQLVVYVENGGVSLVAQTTQKAQTAQNDPVTPAAPAAVEVKSYKVKSGDSLYSIAKKYPGVSTNELRKVNGLNSASIRPGQVLKIPVG